MVESIAAQFVRRLQNRRRDDSPVPIDRGGRKALTISVGRCIGLVRMRCAMVSL
jgi:hypothetical protein